MRIEQKFSLLCALAMLAQIFTISSIPFEIAEPWDKVWHLLAYSALTLLLWIATDGKRPWLVPGAVMFLGACMADLAAAAPAAVITAGALSFLQGKPACVESSPR